MRLKPTDVAALGQCLPWPRKRLSPQKFTLPLPPCVNNLYATVRGRRVKSAEGRAYKHAAGLAALEQGAIRLSGDVSVSMRFYRPRKAGDVDSRIKAGLDALTGICYADDRQVKRLEVEIDDSDPKNPRAEVVVSACEPAHVGIAEVGR